MRKRRMPRIPRRLRQKPRIPEIRQPQLPPSPQNRRLIPPQVLEIMTPPHLLRRPRSQETPHHPLLRKTPQRIPGKLERIRRHRRNPPPPIHTLRINPQRQTKIPIRRIPLELPPEQPHRHLIKITRRPTPHPGQHNISPIIRRVHGPHLPPHRQIEKPIPWKTIRLT